MENFTELTSVKKIYELSQSVETVSQSVENVSQTVEDLTHEFTATFLVTGWSTEAPYTQTVAIEGILETDNPIADVVLSEDLNTAISEESSYANVSKIVTQDGTITATCFTALPQVDLNIQLKVVR